MIINLDTVGQCFIEQYGNFTMVNSQGKAVAINGTQTLRENIADNGGVSGLLVVLGNARNDKGPRLPFLDSNNTVQNKCFLLAMASN
jgi:endothelin-converting enzyme